MREPLTRLVREPIVAAPAKGGDVHAMWNFDWQHHIDALLRHLNNGPSRAHFVQQAG
jgi:hypothetical protein